ncbi:MAG: SusC/RagA family TonB-linked outer membrane protein [Tenuifilaceae bacterium]
MKSLFNTLFAPDESWRRKSILVLIMMLFGVLPLLAQNVEIKGTVYDGLTKEPLPGVNIMVEGNNAFGTSTDKDGKYTLNVPSTDVTLVFSFIGYTSQNINIQGRTLIDVTLEMASTELGEVVAIGYGNVRKKDITGSVSSVKGKDLELIPVSSAVEALTGKMAGVQITTTEGSPDAQIMIRVRGGGSITQDNSPLYIVDGFPVNSISDISASTIQSIDVLKDASSTAIYGSRGANGVIIITTKEGQEGKVNVNYNSYYGFKKFANRLNSLSVNDYVHWQYENALLVDDLPSYEKYFGQYQDIDLYANQPANDWYSQVFGRIGNTLNHDLNINGGSDKFKYSFGFAELKGKEIMLGSDFKRDNLSLKLDHKATKKIDLSFSMRYYNTTINGSGAIEQSNATPTDARLKQTMIYRPIPLTGLSDYSDEEISSSFINPIDNVWDNDRQQNRKNFNMGGSFNWKILDGLAWRTDLGLDNYEYLNHQFYGTTTYYVKNTPAATYQKLPAAILTSLNRTSFRNTNTINYDFKKLLDGTEHNLKFLVGHEMIVTQSGTLTSTIHGYPSFFTSNEAFKLTTQGFAASIDNSYSPDDKMLSFFGRANYDFKGRYLLSATYRADGSSKFLKGNQWGYFPSVAVAWRISEESFMQSFSSVLSNLKLRLSYGTAGNNNIPAGQIAQTFNSSITTYINGVSSIWNPSTIMANPDLKWETTYTRNLGLDFGFFKNRLSGSMEFYKNTTKDLLINFLIPGSGYTSQYRNMGETENKGFELTVDWVAINEKDYGLNLGFNVGFNKNKINSLGVMNDFGQASSWASTEIGNDYRIAVGGSVGEMLGYSSDGRYEVSDFQNYDVLTDTWVLNAGVADNSAVIGKIRPGSMKLKDLTGDGFVNADDISLIGDANPKHTGGFNISGRAYGFDLSAVFSWSVGNDVYNANKIEFSTARYQYWNMTDNMAIGERWNNIDADGNLVNDPALLESMNANTTMWSPYMTRRVFSDWAVEDGSFLRLKTLSLGYTIPSSLTKKVRIQNLRFYATCYNVFILTNYSGFDPEVSTRRATALTPGVDYSAYPKSRQVIFGINLTF